MARIKLRRDTEANWVAANPVLDLGEPGYVTDTQQLKIGNGVNDWNSLPYFFGGFDGGTITNPLEITADGSSFGSALLLTGGVDRTADNAGLLRVGPVLGFTDVNVLASFVDVVDNYAQIIVQNRSGGGTASADIIVNNDVSGATFGNFGINSSGFVGTGGPFDRPNSTYLLSSAGELSVGTMDPYTLVLATNDTSRVEIANTGEVEFQPAANVHILNTTDSTAHDTGALVIEGGLGVGKTIVGDDNLYLGKNAVNIPLTDPVLVAKQNGTGFIQAALINENDQGSADFVAYTESSTESNGWVDMGYTGLNFADPAYTITPPGSAYILSQGLNNTTTTGSLFFVTGNTGTEKDIVFGTGGFFTANERMRLKNGAQQLHIQMTTTSTNTNSGALIVDGGVGIDGALNVGGAVNRVTITPPTSPATLTLGPSATISMPQSLTFPSAAGSSGAVLTTNGSGGLSWTAQQSLNITITPIQYVYSVDYTATLADVVITVDPNGLPRTITLPATAPLGKTFTIKKMTAFPGPTVTVVTDNVFCTIDGNPSYALNNQEAVTVVLGFDGTNNIYFVVGKAV